MLDIALVTIVYIISGSEPSESVPQILIRDIEVVIMDASADNRGISIRPISILRPSSHRLLFSRVRRWTMEPWKQKHPLYCAINLLKRGIFLQVTMKHLNNCLLGSITVQGYQFRDIWTARACISYRYVAVGDLNWQLATTRKERCPWNLQ
jgi:hypothetical protein